MGRWRSCARKAVAVDVVAEERRGHSGAHCDGFLEVWTCMTGSRVNPTPLDGTPCTAHLPRYYTWHTATVSIAPWRQTTGLETVSDIPAESRAAGNGRTAVHKAIAERFILLLPLLTDMVSTAEALEQSIEKTVTSRRLRFAALQRFGLVVELFIWLSTDFHSDEVVIGINGVTSTNTTHLFWKRRGYFMWRCILDCNVFVDTLHKTIFFLPLFRWFPSG